MINLQKYTLILMLSCFISSIFAQKSIRDESITYQQQRMVFRQWDGDKFTPKSGFLGLNPYYWMVWGLHPNYPKTDLRPLAMSGPQTQRLALAGAMSATDKKYELSSDTIGTSAMDQIVGQSPLLSDGDPLWMLYYSKQLKPVYEFDSESVRGSLPNTERVQVLADGNFEWYKAEMEMLAERLMGSRTSIQDRGARILSYYRMLDEYQRLQGIWNLKLHGVVASKSKSEISQKLKSAGVKPKVWSPQSDVEIAKEVLINRKY